MTFGKRKRHDHPKVADFEADTEEAFEHPRIEGELKAQLKDAKRHAKLQKLRYNIRKVNNEAAEYSGRLNA